MMTQPGAPLLPTGAPQFSAPVQAEDGNNVVVVYHVTIVAIGHEWVKKCWSIWFYALQGVPLFETMQTVFFARTTQLLPHPGHEFRLQMVIYIHCSRLLVGQILSGYFGS